MNKYILLLSALLMMSTATLAQEEGKYHIGHETAVKNPVPGEGMIKGSVHSLHHLGHLPGTELDVTDGRMAEVDERGNFEFEVDAGTHKIIISHKGYKDLVIENIVITEGKEVHINIGLAPLEEDKKKKKD